MNRNGMIKLFSLSTLFAAMLPAMQASAAGFQVSEHSAAGLGRAFAGEAAVADDASVVARNPAGMSLLDTTTITVVGSYIVPDVHVEGPNGNSGSQSVAGEAFVPAAYAVIPYNDQIAFGFGGFTNFGFGTDYGSSSGAILLTADKSEIISKNFNASVSYKLNDELSFGLGLNAIHTEAEITSSVPGSNANLMSVKGDDWAFAWNAGVLWQVTPDTRVGFNYRAETKHKLEGKGSSDIINGVGAPQNPYNPNRLNWNDKGSVDLNLPAIAELSVNHQLTDSVSLQASWMRIYWSSFEEIAVKLDNGHPGPRIDSQWKDVNRYSVGATWDYSKQLTLRAGIAKDESPVSDEHRTFRIPDADRMWYTVGGTYTMDDHNSVDFAYGYINGGSEKISESNPLGSGTIDGEIKKSDAHIFSLQYNYRF